MATVAETMQSFNALPEEEKKEVAAQVVQSLAPPSSNANDNLWYIVVGTFAAVVLGGLAALVIMIWHDKSTDVVAPFVTLGAGVLGGLLAPSPVKGA